MATSLIGALAFTALMNGARPWLYEMSMSPASIASVIWVPASKLLQFTLTPMASS